MSSILVAVVLVVGSFATMELVSYAAHRWVMHGDGMVWHRSHHVPPVRRFERNDLFPVCFSLVGVTAFAVAALGPRFGPLFWIAVGITAYGVAYLFVHEVYIHRRLPARLPKVGYLEWLRESHRQHHRSSGEPYGMLLPLVLDRRRGRARERDARRQSLTRAPGRVERADTRATRNRL